MAASSSTIPISIDLQLADLQKKLGEIPGITGDAAKGMLRELVSASKKAEKAVKDANAAAFKDVDKSAAEAREGLLELGDAAGLPIDQLKKLGTGFGAALSSMTSAQLGLVAFSGAAGAAVLALTSAVGISYAVAESIVSLTRASADAIPGLQALGTAMGEQLIGNDDVQRIRSANAALDAVGASASLAGAALATQLAPYVQQVATFLVAANLALTDFIAANSHLVEVMVNVGGAIADLLIAPLKGAALVLGGLLSKSADLADAMGLDLAGSLRSVGDGLLELGQSSVAENFQDMTTALGEYIPQAEKLVTAQAKVNLAFKETKQLTEDEFIAGVNAAIGATGDLFSTTELAAQEANAAIDDIVTAVSDVSAAASDAETALERMTSRMDPAAVTGALGAVQGGLEAIVGLVAGPVAGAIAGLILNLEGTVTDLTAQLMSLPETLKNAPALLTGFIVTLVEAIIPALMAAVPDIAGALVLAVTSPEFLAAIVKLNLMIFNPVTGLKIGVEIARGLWDAFLQGWERFASGEMIDDFRAALVSGIVDAIAEISAFFDELVDQLKDLFTFDGEGAGKVADALREVFTLGSAKTQTYGDSPGVVRAGPKGMTVRVAPNDYLGAHRTREGLADMTGGGGGGGGAPGPVLVDFAFAGRAFDGFFARAARTGQTAVFLRSGVRTGRGR